MLKQKNSIFFVITSLDYGGTQKQLVYLLKYFPSKDYIPVVISLKKNGRFLPKIKKICSKTYDLCLPLQVSILSFFLFLFAFFKFLLLCFRYRPKIIHSFLFQANIFARLARIFFWNTKIICSERVAEKQKLWQNMVNKLTNFLVNKIVVNSEDLRKFVIKYQGVSPSKIVVIPNMIDRQEIQITFPAEDLKRTLNLQKDTFVICSAGRLHKQKGYDLLLEVVKNIVSNCDAIGVPKNFIVIILGDGEEYRNLISYAKKLGISDYVKFLGYRENVYDYISMCNLFVLSSYWEGSPNVVLEALSLGKPVVSTSVEGVNEILDEHYIIPLTRERSDIVKMFTQKIIEFYKLYLNGQTMVSTAKVDFSMYLPEVVLEKYLALYC